MVRWATLSLLLLLGPISAVTVDTVAALVTSLRRHFMAGCVFLVQRTATGLADRLLFLEMQARLAQDSVASQSIGYQDVWRVRCRNSPLFALEVDDENSAEQLKQLSTRRSLAGAVWLLLLLDWGQQEVVLAGVDVPFNSQFLVAQRRNGVIALTEVYRASSRHALQSLHYGQGGGGWPSLNRHERRRDMQGAELQASLMDAPSSVMKVEDGRIKLGGLLGQIWDILQQRMNFTTNFSTPPDSSWGSMDDNGTWNGMIGQVQRKEIHAALGMFTITSERASVVDFTLPLKQTRYLTLMREPRATDLTWASFLAPLSPPLWWAMAACVLVLSAALAALYGCGWHYGEESAEERYYFSFADSLFCMFASLTQQGHDVTPRAASGRLVYLLGYLGAVIFLTAYSAALISFLTVQRRQLPFTDFNGLLADGTYKFGVVASTAEYNLFSSTSNPLMRKIFETLMKPDPNNFLVTVEQGLERVCRTRFVFMVSAGFARNALGKANCSLVNLPDVIFQNIVSVAIVRDSPYLPLINYILQNMRGSGVLKYLVRDLTEVKRPQEEEALQSVQLENVAPILTVLASGVGIALLLFAVELCWPALFSLRARGSFPAHARTFRKVHAVESKTIHLHDTTHYYEE